MNTFRTVLNPLDFPFKISYQDQIMCLGSCFTENIGRFLSNSKFSTFINPFGIIYHPISICGTMSRIMENSQVSKSELTRINDRYYHWDFHGDYSGINPDETVIKLNHQISTAHHFIKTTDFIFITLGTANAFQLVEEKTIVANCHKYPNDKFNRIELSTEEMIIELQKIIDKLKIINPKIKINFTVSPVRHVRDGLVENQLSKAKLIQTVHMLSRSNDHINYFPSYELIMDDLRDYRFYAEDMVHINQVGLNYIWKYFKETFFNEETIELLNSITKIEKEIQHRPFYPESEKHQNFLNQLLGKINKLCKSNPWLDYSNEVKELKGQLTS